MKKSGRVSGRSTSSGRISFGGSSSRGSSSSSGSFGRSSGGFSGGNAQLSGFTLLIIFIFILFVVTIVVIDSIPLGTLFILLALSIIGIGINAVIGKPELTPEDKLYESTITQFQIPNTRAALMEFTIEAIKQIEPVSAMAKMFTVDGRRKDWRNKVWTKKCNGIYSRATIAMKDDASSLNQIKTMMANAGIKV